MYVERTYRFREFRVPPTDTVHAGRERSTMLLSTRSTSGATARGHGRSLFQWSDRSNSCKDLSVERSGRWRCAPSRLASRLNRNVRRHCGHDGYQDDSPSSRSNSFTSHSKRCDQPIELVLPPGTTTILRHSDRGGHDHQQHTATISGFLVVTGKAETHLTKDKR